MADTPNALEATSMLPKVLVSQYLAASETTIYTTSANKAVDIAAATVCNSSGSDRTVYLSVVIAAGTAGSANRVAIITLEPNESAIVEELIGPLGPGDFISGYASAGTAVSVTLRGTISS